MFRAKLKTDKTVQAAVSGSGDIVSFESAFEKPLADLILNITPIQSGEGDPSPTNIRPISGWTGANVYLSPTEDDADATTYPITWTEAGTVYGGTLDVVRGKLRVTHIGETFTDASKISRNNAHNYYIGKGTLKAYPKYASTGIHVISDRLMGHAATASAIYGICFINSSQALRFNTTEEYATSAEMLTGIGGSVQFVYELATPIEYDLDPVTINTLLGQNNVWADCGSVENLRLDAVSGKLKFKLIQ